MLDAIEAWLVNEQGFIAGRAPDNALGWAVADRVFTRSDGAEITVIVKMPLRRATVGWST